MVDLSPVSDHLGGAILVLQATMKPREHDLRALFTREPVLWGKGKESC